MPLLSQITANLFQVQTVGVLPLPIDRIRNAWNAIAKTSWPVVPTANLLSGPGNGSGNSCTAAWVAARACRGSAAALYSPEAGLT